MSDLKNRLILYKSRVDSIAKTLTRQEAATWSEKVSDIVSYMIEDLEQVDGLSEPERKMIEDKVFVFYDTLATGINYGRELMEVAAVPVVEIALRDERLGNS
jgi:hypothetical protein